MKKGVKKWMNTAGYFVIITFIFILISGANTIFKFSNLGIYINIADIIISLFLFLGFITLAKFSKNRFLQIISWIILLVSVVISIFSSIIPLNPSILNFLATHYFMPRNLNLGTFLFFFFPSGIRSILDIFLGLSLFKIEKIKFAKQTGVFIAIIGVLYSISYLIICPIILLANKTSQIFQFFQATQNFSSYFIVILAIILFGALTFFESKMFFTASEKFER